ncbi:hypothetical protein HDV02_003475 [Globomyces sp. JEL0801]|nr:hypothetical protein HDV02_003475 [Globomyces sp. JEL0801]
MLMINGYKLKLTPTNDPKFPQVKKSRISGKYEMFDIERASCLSPANDVLQELESRIINAVGEDYESIRT